MEEEEEAEEAEEDRFIIIISKNRTMAQVKFRLIKIILTIKVLIEKNTHKIEVR